MISFTIQIIVLLFILGGLIAFSGNYVGKYIGKRRLTLFNLRPRYTATIITVFSGILIALSTLGVVLAISQDARTALLGMEEIKKQLTTKGEELAAANRELTAKITQLNAAKQEIEQVQAVKKKLSQEVRITREGQIIYNRDQVISLSLIQGGPERSKIKTGLKRIVAAANSELWSLGMKPGTPIVEVANDNFEEALNTLTSGKKMYVIKLISARNVLWGETVPARLELVENQLLYRSQSEIYSAEAPANLTATQAEQEILKILKGAHQAAREAGVLPDTSGSMGGIPYAQILDFSRKIKGSWRKGTIRILAKKNIYTIGPLEVDFKVTYP